MLSLIFFTMEYFIRKHVNYLNSLCNIEPNELKSPEGRLQRYSLIKNIKHMKKFIGWSILLIVVAIIGVGTIIVFDSREYFKDYFDSQRKELNLRSEASVDSLKTVINNNTKIIDSLSVVNVNLEDKNRILDNNIKTLKKTNDWLKSCLVW